MEVFNFLFVVSYFVGAVVILFMVGYLLYDKYMKHTAKNDTRWNYKVYLFKKWIENEMKIANSGTTTQLKEAIDRLNKLGGRNEY